MGKVYLVGAGPGDPGLITMRGVQCLREADLVLYDGLVNPLLLRWTKGVCERTARARCDGSPVVPQAEINERLIREARAGRTVVRLKGGDPYIFGRGSEEAAALASAGIPFEVVPGITAATAAGEYAGFSFTHRDISSAVAFITGHEDPTRETSRIDYHALAKFPGTLVFYMGLSRLRELCAQLVDSGMKATTPAAVICKASLPAQQVVEGTLVSLPDLAAAQQLKPPSLIVVGDCVTQRSALSWFERLPLFGVSIGIARPEEQADGIAEEIVRLGGEPVLMPLIEVRPVDDSQAEVIQAELQRLSDFQWLIFTSVNGVSEFLRHLYATGRDARALAGCQLAAIGSGTADALQRSGLRPDLVPEQFRAEAIAEAIVKVAAPGSRVLWLRASRGREVLPERLATAGILLTQLVVYENSDVDSLSPAVLHRLQDGSLHWIALSSPSIARRLVELLAQGGIDLPSLRTRLASISPVTTAAAQEAGLSVVVEADEFTWAGLLTAIRSFRPVAHPPFGSSQPVESSGPFS
jgi:uroporphyrinogen III methyltransferase/synthase